MKELTLFLDSKKNRRLYEQIYDQMVEMIRTGKLLVGERLPSTRSLAQSLSISRSTVELAYSQLQAEGYIEARPYKGNFVASYEDLLQIEKPEPVEVKEEVLLDNYRIDFSANTIDMSLFPFETWRKLTRNTLNDDRIDLFSSGIPQGDLPLRETIMRYLHSARGVRCSADQIIIGAGNDYLLMLLKYILGEKRIVAMENPSYARACRIFESVGYEVRTIPMDKQGMSAAHLMLSGASVAYVMPSHQYPTGIIMPIGRRMELLSWAESKEERYLIEDDYDSEFRYRGKPIPSLQASDRSGKVIYIGTFSKAIAPAIRISYMVLPKKLMEVYHEKCGFLSSTVSRLDQAILNEFIRDGYFERYLNKMRKHYHEKQELVLQELKPLKPHYLVSGDGSGLHVLLTSRGDMTAKQMAFKALTMGIRIYPLEECILEGKTAADPEKTIISLDHTVILGFGGLSKGQIQAGLKLLKRIL